MHSQVLEVSGVVKGKHEQAEIGGRATQKRNLSVALVPAMSTQATRSMYFVDSFVDIEYEMYLR